MNMNKIKDTFSKVKASDEFKNRLTNNLQSSSIEKKHTISKKNYGPMAAGYKLAVPNKPQG
jgi:hypothetical protein